jgi:hypothetical protein
LPTRSLPTSLRGGKALVAGNNWLRVARNGDVIRETAWHTRQLAFRFSVPTVYLMSGKLRHIRFAMCTNIFRDTEEVVPVFVEFEWRSLT